MSNVNQKVFRENPTLVSYLSIGHSVCVCLLCCTEIYVVDFLVTSVSLPLQQIRPTTCNIQDTQPHNSHNGKGVYMT